MGKFTLKAAVALHNTAASVRSAMYSVAKSARGRAHSGVDGQFDAAISAAQTIEKRAMDLLDDAKETRSTAMHSRNTGHADVDKAFADLRF